MHNAGGYSELLNNVKIYKHNYLNPNYVVKISDSHTREVHNMHI